MTLKEVDEDSAFRLDSFILLHGPYTPNICATCTPKPHAMPPNFKIRLAGLERIGTKLYTSRQHNPYILVILCTKNLKFDPVQRQALPFLVAVGCCCLPHHKEQHIQDFRCSENWSGNFQQSQETKLMRGTTSNLLLIFLQESSLSPCSQSLRMARQQCIDALRRPRFF